MIKKSKNQKVFAKNFTRPTKHGRRRGAGAAAPRRRPHPRGPRPPAAMRAPPSPSRHAHTSRGTAPRATRLATVPEPQPPPGPRPRRAAPPTRSPLARSFVRCSRGVCESDASCRARLWILRRLCMARCMAGAPPWRRSGVGGRKQPGHPAGGRRHTVGPVCGSPIQTVGVLRGTAPGCACSYRSLSARREATPTPMGAKKFPRPFQLELPFMD